MSDALIDLAWLAQAVAKRVDGEGEKDAERISLAALKFTSDTINAAQAITTEGISDDERAAYIRSISEAAEAEVFEFSTCNRVLYVSGAVSRKIASRLVARVCAVRSAELMLR